jgi:hypothetical protein
MGDPLLTSFGRRQESNGKAKAKGLEVLADQSGLA